MKRQAIFFFFLFLLSCSYSQQDSSSYCIVFYNVENLFDPENDPEKNDDVFTPTGLYRWSYKRYSKKINHTAKVFLAIGKYSPPDIIGLAEIENANVLKRLCYSSPLKKYNYKFIHYESADFRGIDVALLYNSDRVEIINSIPINITFPFSPESQNRDILYAVACLKKGKDTVHLFVNHWTSRYGGYAQTVEKRNYYAQVLRHKVDSLFALYLNPNIVIMGDFNDYPDNESLASILKAMPTNQTVESQKLINLMTSFSSFSNVGTHKYEDFWGTLDQLIVSSALLSNSNPLQISKKKAHIFREDFLVESDTKYGGVKPLRTYLGPRYIGGYSDHLPIYILLKTGKKEH